VKAIIGHGLESVVLNSDRQIRAGQRAEVTAAGEKNLRPEIPGRHFRPVRLSAEGIGTAQRITHIGTLKRVRDQWHVQAQSKTLGEIVAGNQMSDGAVQKIRVRAPDLLARKLERVEGDEQLRDRKQQALARFSPRIIRSVDGAQVTRCGWGGNT
jgi:hypothetical protein